MKNRYMIFSKDNMAHRFSAEDAKLAVCDYAEHCGCAIEKPILARIQAVMTLEELVEFFNSHGSLDYNDKITEIIKCHATIYPEEVFQTGEEGGSDA
jgi:hypothetical protein